MKRKLSNAVASRGRRVPLGASVLALALVLVAGAMSGTGSEAATSARQATISMALVLDDCVNPVERPLRAGAQRAARKLKFSLKIVCPSPVTAQAQITLMQTLIVQRPKAIVILPVDSVALVPIINQAVEAGITVATTELDAPRSKRAFFYFGGTPTLGQGKMQANRVFAYLKQKRAKGTINFYVTSCLPTVTGQQDRRRGFEQQAAKLNRTKSKFK